jgi:hypothetical protein
MSLRYVRVTTISSRKLLSPRNWLSNDDTVVSADGLGKLGGCYGHHGSSDRRSATRKAIRSHKCHSGDDYVILGFSVQLLPCEPEGPKFILSLSRPPPSTPPSPFSHDARHAHCLPRRGLCPPLHPRSFRLVRAHGHRRTIRSSRAGPRRCISCVLCTSPSRSYTYSFIDVSGNPFRESGPPACMAKLIMMRHKVRKKQFHSAQPRAVYVV